MRAGQTPMSGSLAQGRVWKCDVTPSLMHKWAEIFLSVTSWCRRSRPFSSSSFSSSPYNPLFSRSSPPQIRPPFFLMLLTDVPCESVSCSHSISLYFTFLPSISLSPLSPSIFPTWRREEMCPPLRNCFYLWSIAFHSATLCIGPRNEWQFNALLYTLRPVILGVIVSKWFWQTPFFFITDVAASPRVCEDAQRQPHFDLCNVIIDSSVFCSSFWCNFQFSGVFFLSTKQKQKKFDVQTLGCFLEKKTENSVNKDNKSV